MMKALKIIYGDDIYTLSIVFIALFSLFYPVSNQFDLLINIIFVLDLLISSTIYMAFSPQKNLNEYLKLHTFDILSCIPVQFLSIFKAFRLIRLVRISRLFKLSRTTSVSNKITISNLFKFDTFKELSIYLIIYLIANAYVFKEIEQISALNSFYWVITTITTVGYGDIYPTHTITKIMAMVLMVVGVSVMGYINGAVISSVMEQYKKYK